MPHPACIGRTARAKTLPGFEAGLDGRDDVSPTCDTERAPLRCGAPCPPPSHRARRRFFRCSRPWSFTPPLTFRWPGLSGLLPAGIRSPGDFDDSSTQSTMVLAGRFDGGLNRRRASGPPVGRPSRRCPVRNGCEGRSRRCSCRRRRGCGRSSGCRPGRSIGADGVPIGAEAPQLDDQPVAPRGVSFQRTTLGAWWWTMTRSRSPSPSRSPQARPRPMCKDWK